jgi:hypothetical protein
MGKNYATKTLKLGPLHCLGVYYYMYYSSIGIQGPKIVGRYSDYSIIFLTIKVPHLLAFHRLSCSSGGHNNGICNEASNYMV